MKVTLKTSCKRPNLDSKVPRTCITYPGGKEVRVREEFRIGDYFDEIEEGDGTLTFHVKAGANSTWKYVAVSILNDRVIK